MRSPLALRETLFIAFRALRANKGRGALTTLGIIIGIVAVVTTMTAVNGLQNRFRESLSAMGTDVIYVSRMPWVVMNDFFRYRNRPPLDLREARLLEARMRGKALVNPTVSSQEDVKYRSEIAEGVTILGTSEKELQMSAARPEFGRFLMPLDVFSKRRVCVIGRDIRDGLFPRGANPLKKTIRIGRVDFVVVGVMEKQGGGIMGGPNFDRQIYVPITSWVKAFGNRRGRVDLNIAVKAPRQEELGDLEYTVIGEMRKLRQLRPAESDDFSINKLDNLTGTFSNVMGIVLLVGLLVTSISLLVGAIGVMNIMFVSVTERTKEIGLRKAVGATKKSILLLFLFESAAICLTGGVIGIILAAGVTAIINATLMPASPSVPIVVIAIVISIAVGIAAGVAPALRGAHLDPIEALRHE
jgi:putative ABC transport system permease protein